MAGTAMNRRQRRAAAAKAKRATGYLDRILAAPIGPGVYHVSVFHDRDCPIYSGGACECVPEIHRRRHGGNVVETIGLDGETTTESVQ
jgi:hypothetical protein